MYGIACCKFFGSAKKVIFGEIDSRLGISYTDMFINGYECFV